MGIGSSAENEQRGGGVPPLDSLSVEEQLSLIRHLRSEYETKVEEIVKTRSQDEKACSNDIPLVVTKDVDDLLYAQIEIEGLIASFKTLKDEGPMTEIDIDVAISKLFKQYETDPLGNMKAGTFKQLMIDVLGGNQDAPSEKDVQKFLNYMDKNNNGMIEKDELVAFIIDGSSATEEERKAFSERSPFHEKLSRFLVLILASVAKTIGKGTISGKALVASVSQAMAQKVEAAVNNMFSKYDTDESGHIDVDEFHKFMLEVVADKSDQRKPTRQDAIRFIGIIDGRQNKNIESKGLSKQSVIDFATNVMTSKSEERLKFAAASSMHHKLIDFFLSLLLESLSNVTKTIDMIPEEVLKKRAAAIENLIKVLWEKYDEDKDDALNAKEFKSMIEGVTGGSLSEKDCQRFLKRMDTSGDGLIQGDEFAEFVEQGLALSSSEKSKYASRSPMHAMLVSVFVNAERLIQENGESLDEALQAKSTDGEVLPKSIDALFDHLWEDFDKDKDGALNALELAKCFLHLTGQEIEIEECDRFLQRIDSSGDGKVQKDELIEFIENGIRMSPEKRKQYRQRSDMHSSLLDLFDSVMTRVYKNGGENALKPAERGNISNASNGNRKVEQKNVESEVYSAASFVAKIWGTFDLDKDGQLNAKEAKCLLEKFTGHDVSEEICAKFLKSIDVDGDAMIQPDELTTFITNGIKLKPSERQEYSSRSPTHETIIEFFNEVDLRLKGEVSLEKELGNTTARSGGHPSTMETEEERILINAVVDEIWRRYDKDGTNKINATEFQAMMTDCVRQGGESQATPKLEETRKFLKFLDQDGDNTLDRNEFHEFILYGSRMTSEQRVEYAKRSSMHAKLMIFISVLIEETKVKQEQA
eukprot:g7014.t1